MKISSVQDLIPISKNSNSSMLSRHDALEKFNSFNPALYAKTRNFHNGHVSMLSPYLSRGLITVSFLIDFFSNKIIECPA